MFIHLFKSRKSHGHLATLHCSGVAQNTCILECVYILYCTIIVLSLLLHPKRGHSRRKQQRYHDRGGALSECGGCTIAFTLVQKKHWHWLPVLDPLLLLSLNSSKQRWRVLAELQQDVGLVTHRKRQTVQKQKKTIAGGETDRHKEPGRIFGEGKHEKSESKCTIGTSPRILCGNNEGAFYLIVHYLHVQQ